MAEKRSSIIESVKTPLGLLALVVLAIEGLLTLSIQKLPQDQLIYAVAGMIGTFIGRPRHHRFILFSGTARRERAGVRAMACSTISTLLSAAPMSAIPKRTTSGVTKEVNQLIDHLRSHTGLKEIAYSGSTSPKYGSWDLEGTSLEKNLRRITRSRSFILIHPVPAQTSALIEVGFAIAQGMRVLLITPDRKSLPFLLRSPEKSKLADISVLDYTKLEDVTAKLDELAPWLLGADERG